MTGRIVWSDEFDGPAGAPPDSRYWRHQTGAGGWGNGELQTYTADPANAFLDGDGHLIIRARRTGDGYSSARLVTQNLVSVAYGRLECRARLPAGAGLWSAFWALGTDIDTTPWPACGEIDIMENLGTEPHRLFGTVHCPGRSGRHGVSGDGTSSTSLHESFHDFAVEWTQDRIIWLLDGRPYFTVHRDQLGAAWVFDHPFYLLLNLAVGGWLGGEEVDEAAFPADLVVDSVRIRETG